MSIVDVNPAKQGKFVPWYRSGSASRRRQHFRAWPAGATIFVMNSNYLPEIREMSNNAYRYIGVDHG